MKPLKLLLLLFGAAIFTTDVAGQMKINGSSVVKVNGIMSMNSSLINLSTNTDFSESSLVIQGTTVEVSTPQPTLISSIQVNEAGVKTLSGNWDVSNELVLTEGILKIANGSKLTYSGSSPLTGQSSSFIDGFLFRRGSGRMLFPIGAGSQYSPAVLENPAQGEYGVRVVPQDPAFAITEPVEASFTGQYWEVAGSPNSTISLSLNGMDSFLEGKIPVVLEAAATGSIATSLSGTVADNFVISAQNISQPIVGVGALAEFALVIHDLVTPFTRDEVNDKIHIKNIHLTTSNKVKLLDRYGVVVGEWTNYSNDIDFDFQKFSPGNYLCIVEYDLPASSAKSVVKGMITILKAN
jgi:hypothetical protein